MSLYNDGLFGVLHDTYVQQSESSHHHMDPDQAQKALEKFDTDGDGKISSAELRAGLIDLEVQKQKHANGLQSP